MPAIGTVLGGKYRVEAKIGEGGMGTVFRAENTITGKKVALKWMHPHVAANPVAAERFLREARASARLQHPNIVDVYDVVRDDATLFLVMELLHGGTLRAFMARQPKPTLVEFIAQLLPALSGVAAAHAHGVIHRDLKPDNIFVALTLGAAPTSKVLDFGIAKLASSHGSTLTETGSSLGTPAYMSFEQLRGDKDIDARADVYAFGVMLFEALTGRRPYRGATLSELAIYVATTQPAPVRSLNPDAPEALAAIVDRAVARERAQRWPDAPSLMSALVPFASEAGFRAHMAEPSRALPCVAALVRDEGSASGSSAWEPPLAATASLHSLAPAPVARNVSVSEAPPDTLSARELRRERRQHPPAWPIWLAAGVALTVSALAAFLLLRASSEPSAPHASLPVPVNEAPRAAMPAAQPPVPEPPLPAVQLSPEPAAPPVVHEDPDAPVERFRAERKPARATASSRVHARAAARSAPAERPAAANPAARTPTDLLGF